jgi:hypothetical protein
MKVVPTADKIRLMEPGLIPLLCRLGKSRLEESLLGRGLPQGSVTIDVGG